MGFSKGWRSVLAFLKSTDGSALALLKSTDGSVLPSPGYPQSSPARIPVGEFWCTMAIMQEKLHNFLFKIE